MVIYGSVGVNKDGEKVSARCLHGGARFIIPVIQGCRFLDLTPISIGVDIKQALSGQNTGIDILGRFTVAISTEPGIMENAAERLLGLNSAEIEELAREIIFGQLRLAIAVRGLEEIDADRDMFLEGVCRNTEIILRQIGLRLINVNLASVNLSLE